MDLRRAEGIDAGDGRGVIRNLFVLRIVMRTCSLTIVLALIPGPVLAAEMIKPEEAPAHVGQMVTVEGTISDVHHAKSGRATLLNMGGRYPNNVFTAVIFADDASKFPNVDSLIGKAVGISGSIHVYKGRPEIILNDAGQIKIK
jgi:DNA/RNA endonuclease YhcR with UshA esterase domain